MPYRHSIAECLTDPVASLPLQVQSNAPDPAVVAHQRIADIGESNLRYASLAGMPNHAHHLGMS